MTEIEQKNIPPSEKPASPTVGQIPSDVKVTFLQRLPYKVLAGVLAILVFVLIGLVYAVFVYQPPEVSLEGESVVIGQEHEENVLQVYTNGKYGFELQYPSDWEVQESIITNQSNPGFRIDFRDINNQADYISISITERYPMLPDWDQESPYTTWTIGGVQLHEELFENGYCDGAFCSGPFKSYWFEKGGYIYAISLDTLEPSEFDQKIFASLQFENISGRTYTNEKFGYQFVYPSTWNLKGDDLSPVEIEYYEIGSDNAPIHFGVYSEDQEMYLQHKDILNFSRIASLIELDGDSSIVGRFRTGSGLGYLFYELTDYGSYDGVSAGRMALFVSDRFTIDGSELRLVFEWEEFPGGKQDIPNVREEFISMLSSVALLERVNTYQNEEYTLLFDIPVGWQVDEDRSSETVETLEVVFEIGIPSSRESVRIERNGPDYRKWISDLNQDIILSRQSVKVGPYTGERVDTSEFGQSYIVFNRGDDFVRITGSRIFDSVILETIDFLLPPDGWVLYNNKENGVHFFYPETWLTEKANIDLFGVYVTSPDSAEQIVIRQIDVSEYSKLLDSSNVVKTVMIEGKSYTVYTSSEIMMPEFMLINVLETDKIFILTFTSGYLSNYDELVASFLQ